MSWIDRRPPGAAPRRGRSSVFPNRAQSQFRGNRTVDWAETSSSLRQGERHFLDLASVAPLGNELHGSCAASPCPAPLPLWSLTTPFQTFPSRRRHRHASADRRRSGDVMRDANKMSFELNGLPSLSLSLPVGLRHQRRRTSTFYCYVFRPRVVRVEDPRLAPCSAAEGAQQHNSKQMRGRAPSVGSGSRGLELRKG